MTGRRTHPLLRKTHWLLSQQLGLDLTRAIRAPVGLLRYIRDLLRFSRKNMMTLRLQPCLHDWWERAGAVSNEYFWQDLFVARMIYEAAPRHHIDIGSRLDGFVAHIATFRELEVYDVRPLDILIPRVHFRHADVMNCEALPAGVADSVSCLHAIEHFGLGRYGDPLAADGVLRGFRSLAHFLEPRGRLYLSCPIGNDVIHFNAHRALHPSTVVSLANQSGLDLESCWVFDENSKAFDLLSLPLSAYTPSDRQTLAVYRFIKLP